MKNYFFLLLIPLAFGCKKDITGHWHTKSNKYKNADASIDIIENNDCYFTYSLSSKSIKGEHFPDKKQIFFPSQCGELSFKYKIKNNKLYLESAIGNKLIAKRIVNKCSRFNDFKSRLKIGLVKIKKRRKFFKPEDSIENEGLNQYILINRENDSIKIEFFGRINSLDKINEITVYIDNSVSDAEIPYLNYVLVPGKEILISDLKTIIDLLNKDSKRRIFIQTLKINPNFLSTFEYINIDKIDLTSEMTLGKYFN